MAKGLIRVFWLLIGLVGIGYGSYYLFQKQYFPVSHYSFASAECSQIFIPDLLSLSKKENGLAVVESYADDTWNEVMESLVDNRKRGVSANISWHNNIKTISFEGFGLIDLKRIANNEISKGQNTIEIGDSTYYFWASKKMLALSNSEINPAITKAVEQERKGNADFFFIGQDRILETIKLNENIKFSSFLSEESSIKGKPLSAHQMLGICPISSTHIKYFGSSRFLSDSPVLLGQDSVSDLSWIKSELIYMQKDSFEALASVQSDGIQLKNMLLEAIAEKNGDTAITESIYYNSIEILPFDIDWNWQELCKNIEGELHYFATYNNFIFLTNNLQSMYWLIRSNQLGKTYEAFHLSRKIPARVHNLTLQKIDNSTAISSKTWISKNRCINLSAMSNSVVQSNASQHLQDFSYIGSCNFLLLTNTMEQKNVLVVSENEVLAHNFKGEELWTYSLKSPISTQPKQYVSDDQSETLIIIPTNKNITIINDQGSLVKTIDSQFKNKITELNILSGNTSEFFLAKSSYSVTVYRMPDGKKILSVSGQNAIQSAQIEQTGAMETLNVMYQNDSLKIFDLQSKVELLATSANGVTGKLLPSIQGNFSSKQDLRLIAYENDFLKIKYLNNPLVDSIKLNLNTSPDKTHWINFEDSWMLALEYYDRLLIYNILGLVEAEISKPELNTMFIVENYLKNNIFAFKNTTNNQLYFTDKYGNLMINNPISSDGKTFPHKPFLINKFNNRIHIYKLNY